MNGLAAYWDGRVTGKKDRKENTQTEPPEWVFKTYGDYNAWYVGWQEGNVPFKSEIDSVCLNASKPEG